MEVLFITSTVQSLLYIPSRKRIFFLIYSSKKSSKVWVLDVSKFYTINNTRQNFGKTLSEDGGLIDILQVLKEQSIKMEKLDLTLKIICLPEHPSYNQTSIEEALEVSDSLLNTHKFLSRSGVKIQKRLESYPASRKMGIFRRPRSASLGCVPKTVEGGEEGSALSPEERMTKKGKGRKSPSYSEATRSQTPKEVRE